MRQLSRARPHFEGSWASRRSSLRRGAAFLVIAAVAVGCAATPQGHHHHRPPLTDDEPETPPVKVEPWVGFSELSKLTAVGEARVSGHRLGDETGTIRINALASPYSTGGPMPEGATIVEALSPETGGVPTTYFVMTKRQAGYFPAGGDWEYLVVNASGGAVARGELPKCARCHAEAAHAFLFAGAKVAPKPVAAP